MGKRFVDIHTISHFLMGMISYYLINKLNIPLINNFIICNGTHLYIELIENNISPRGKILETFANHIGDIIFFLIGWIVSKHIKFEKYIPDKYTKILWVFLIFELFKEIYREVRPYNNIPFLSGSFT